MRYNASEDDEYFSIPRGRVLWDPVNLQSIVCHGNETSATRLKEIAAFFKLTDWTAQTDIHHMMGNAADHAFDD